MIFRAATTVARTSAIAPWDTLCATRATALLPLQAVAVVVAVVAAVVAVVADAHFVISLVIQPINALIGFHMVTQTNRSKNLHTAATW